jgi:hypothetical protein
VDPPQNHTYDEATVPYAGLMPPGFVDGGIAHKSADYGTVWWVLIALEHAMDAAARLGFLSDAREWEELHSQLQRPLRTAILRDLRRDEHGTEYLPITIGDTTSGIPPQRGQFTFLLPFPYGRSFFRKDALLERAIKERWQCWMERPGRNDRERVDARWCLVCGSVIHGMAHHYRTLHAWACLQAFADHATAGTWVEEQQPRSVEAHSR